MGGAAADDGEDLCGNRTVAAAAGHASILWAGGIENVWMTCCLFSVLVVFTLVWELGTERLEQMVHGHHAYEELLHKVYKELTSLGFLSFGLFIVQDTTLVQINHELLISFEFAHYLIFFMALIFVIFALTSLRGSLATKREWDAAAAKSVHEVCEAYTAKLQWTQNSWLGRLVRACGGLELYMAMTAEQQTLEWFLLRVLFLREYGVQIHFDFGKYLLLRAITLSLLRSVQPYLSRCLTG